MKLKIETGELNLPEGFSFEIEQNSAFFSENGAASIAATIPATPSDLAKLGHPTRIARKTRYANLFPAIISAGVFQKKGTLVVNSASEDEGISCAVALEDSDFYSNWKEKNLKELFSERVLTAYHTPGQWYNYLFNVYKGLVTNDFRVIPVAVNYNSSDGSYQVNNEPKVPSSSYDSSTIFELEHESRIIKEGDDKVSVPDGYGIAPFYKLYAFFERMFELCGYTVRNNCFRTNSDLNTLILLHNCSDVICNGRIDCSDLVPNVSIEDILEWILKKFHAQIVVFPTTATADIVLMEDILSAGYDKNLTGHLFGKLTYTFRQSSRVVITPDTTLDGAAPAANTMEELKKKYGAVIELMTGDNLGQAEMGLALQKATGVYYEIAAQFSTYNPRGSSNANRFKRLGTNYFTYDRQNSKDSDQMDADDLIPPMVWIDGYLMPYIGDRRHRNTTYNDSDKDEDQEIIIVDYAGLSTPVPITPSGSGNPQRLSPYEAHSGHYYYGTTQKYDNTGADRTGRYNLNAPEMYERFFARYNKMLRNCMVKVEGKFDLSVEDILNFKMYSLKLFEGQMLLPESLRYEVGRKIQCLSASFYQVKNYSDAEEDVPTVIPAPRFRWQLNDTSVQNAKASAEASAGRTLITKYTDEYATGEKDFFLPAPTAAGQKSATIYRDVEFGYTYSTHGSASGGATNNYRKVSEATDLPVWFVSVEI